jgi:2-keto-4-pentenoate hydratase/2-oxohepta-3-ene-1,7-dioic acid hydratase in catechol pathway
LEVCLKFVNFTVAGHDETHLGCHWGMGCLDISRAVRDRLLQFGRVDCIEDLLQLKGGVQNLEKQLEKFRDDSKIQSLVIPFEKVTLQAPVTRSLKVIGIGLNYRDHSEETGIAIPKSPLLFGMYANAIVGPDAPIVIPTATEKVDYEAELAVVIGARGRNVSRDDAMNYVAGYTIANDVSARDLQFAEKQWTRAKSIDTFLPIGPCLVSQSELGDGSGLDIRLRLNGQTMQNSNTRFLIFDVPALVSHISQTMTLEPGDIISTGTPSGVGYTRNPPVFLKQGDLVEVEIEGIGVLRNPVIDGSQTGGR